MSRSIEKPLGMKKDDSEKSEPRSSEEREDSDLLGTLISLSGLPEEWVRGELDPILDEKGSQKQELTLNEVREALAAYLESIGPDFGLQAPVDLDSSEGSDL